MAEFAELGDVAAKEESNRPVGDEAGFAGETGRREQVVGAAHPPRQPAAHEQASHLRDSGTAAQCDGEPEAAVVEARR